jgi:hypothetical protein
VSARVGLLVGVQMNQETKEFRAKVDFIVDGKRSDDFVTGKRHFPTAEEALKDGQAYCEEFLKANADQISLERSYFGLTREEANALVERETAVLQ